MVHQIILNNSRDCNEINFNRSKYSFNIPLLRLIDHKKLEDSKFFNMRLKSIISVPMDGSDPHYLNLADNDKIFNIYMEGNGVYNNAQIINQKTKRNKQFLTFFMPQTGQDFTDTIIQTYKHTSFNINSDDYLYITLMHVDRHNNELEPNTDVVLQVTINDLYNSANNLVFYEFLNQPNIGVDSISSLNNLTQTNVTYQLVGGVDDSALFDGSASYFSLLPYNTVFEKQHISISFFFKTTAALEQCVFALTDKRFIPSTANKAKYFKLNIKSDG